jgi:predicted ester cyclase
MDMAVDDLIANGDKTVARVTVKATHRGDFMRVPPTGSLVEMELIDIMRFDAAGLVCERWGVADMLGLMQQLDVVSPGRRVTGCAHPFAARPRRAWEGMMSS